MSIERAYPFKTPRPWLPTDTVTPLKIVDLKAMDLPDGTRRYGYGVKVIDADG